MNPKVKIRAFKPPVGEAYGRIEAPKGELGFYLISDGSGNPYRYRVRPPSFDQPNDSGRHVPRAHRGGRDGDSRQHRYRNGRGGSMMIGGGSFEGHGGDGAEFRRQLF